MKNPKEVEAGKRGKIDYSVVPWDALWGLVHAMTEGSDKYGRFNYYESRIRARTYIAAISRHLFGDPSTGSLGWVNGEDYDEESGLHHLHKVMACCAVVLASYQKGTLIDDRLDPAPPTIKQKEEDSG